MLANRQRALDWVFADEGGYVERGSEPGRAGNLGIGFSVFAAWMKLHGNMPNATFDDLKALTEDTASAIYEAEWMTPIHFDQLAAGTDYSLFNTTVNLGVGGGVRMLQHDILGFVGNDITGHMDIITMAAVVEMSKTRDMGLMINDAWLSTKKTSPEWPEFGPGWISRAAKVRARLSVMH